MNTNKHFELAEALVGKTYIQQGRDSIQSYSNLIKNLLSQRRLPENGWSRLAIELLMQNLAMMDSNNFAGNVGVGEREARIICPIIQERNFYLGHGIGRSGDIAAIQPKAAGSSLLSQLTNILVKGMVHIAGITRIERAIVLPVSTGMATMLTLLSLKLKNPNANVVVWPRIDQKSCFKAILTAGLTPVIVENVLEGDELRSDLSGIVSAIINAGVENVLCVMTTTSCFAPRGCDRVVEVADVCLNYNVAHVINNAYGLQSSKCCHLINEAMRTGRVDACIQSTDKNFMVPVGGSVVCGPRPEFIEEVGKAYPGRASSCPTSDLFITMLHLGRSGYRKVLAERKQIVPYFKEQLSSLAQRQGERLLETPHNQISFAITLGNLYGKDSSSIELKLSMLGSMLFKRNVSGARVVTGLSSKKIQDYYFRGYGAHSNDYPVPYLTAACAIGITKEEVDIFCIRLEACISDLKEKSLC